MWRRHRRPTQKGEVLSRRGVGRVRREAGKDVDPRRRYVGLEHVCHRRGTARRKRGHDVAGVAGRQKKTFVEHDGDVVTGIELGEDQIAVGLADHDRRYVGEAFFTVHDDRVTSVVVNDDRDRPGIFGVADHLVETAAAALQERNVAVHRIAVDQRLAGVRRIAGPAAGQRVVVIIRQH